MVPRHALCVCQRGPDAARPTRVPRLGRSRPGDGLGTDRRRRVRHARQRLHADARRLFRDLVPGVTRVVRFDRRFRALPGNADGVVAGRTEGHARCAHRPEERLVGNGRSSFYPTSDCAACRRCATLASRRSRQKSKRAGSSAADGACWASVAPAGRGQSAAGRPRPRVSAAAGSDSATSSRAGSACMSASTWRIARERPRCSFRSAAHGLGLDARAWAERCA